MESEHFWYRADVRLYSVISMWDDDEYYSSPRVTYLKYKVIKTTPKGVWIEAFLQKPVFVLGTAKKQYAVPTKELALLDLKRRKEIHWEMAKKRADSVKRLLDRVNSAIGILVC